MLETRKEKKKPSDIRDEIKKQIATIPSLPNGLEYLIVPFDPIGSGLKPFNLIIQSKKYDELPEITNRVYKQIKEIEELSSPSVDLKQGIDELQITINDDLARHFGVNSSTVGQEIRARIEGLEVGKYYQDSQDFKVTLKANDNNSFWIDRKSEIFIPNVNMIPIDLRKIASFSLKKTTPNYSRYNQKYSATISAGISSGASLSKALDKVKNIMDTELKNNKNISYDFDGDAYLKSELEESLKNAMFLGITVLFLVLSSLYGSFLISFFNIITLPFALSGAFMALYLFHKDLNLYSMIGLLLLIGLATKNSILLIDTVKDRDKTLSQKEFENLILFSSIRRFRPILMTSLTLIAGAVPIAIGLNEISAQRTSMGIAIIGGMISSTLFSLLLVPILLVLLKKFQLLFIK